MQSLQPNADIGAARLTLRELDEIAAALLALAQILDRDPKDDETEMSYWAGYWIGERQRRAEQMQRAVDAITTLADLQRQVDRCARS